MNGKNVASVRIRYMIHSNRVGSGREGDVGLFDLLTDMTR